MRSWCWCLWMQAYHLGLYGPRIVYLMMGYYSSITWSQSTNFSDCTPDQIMETIDGSFYIGVAMNTDNQVSVSGRTVEGFWQEFIRRIGPDLVNTTYVHPLTSYDSVWMTALALDRAEKTFIANGRSLRLLVHMIKVTSKMPRKLKKYRVILTFLPVHSIRLQQDFERFYVHWPWPWPRGHQKLLQAELHWHTRQDGAQCKWRSNYDNANWSTAR